MPADDAVAWVGTALTPLVLIAEYRLRRDLLVGRWLSLIDPPRQWPCWFSHILLLSGLPPLICPETQKERRFDGFTKPTNRRSKLCETFL